MSLLDRFSSSRSTETSGYEAAEIDADLADALTSPGERDAISVRPHKDNGGIEAMGDVLESLHSVDTESPLLRGGETNISSAHTFEMRFTRPPEGGDRAVSLHYVAGDDRTDGALERQLQTQYPDSQLNRMSSRLLADDVEGRYVAGATLNLRRYTLYPIKNIDLPGFTTDPTGSILEEMVGAQDETSAGADVIVQMQFKPAHRSWTQGVEDGHGVIDDDDESVRGTPSIKMLAKNLRQPTYEKQWRTFPFTREEVEYSPSKVDKQVAKLLEEQQGEKGWRLCLRVLAVSEDREVVVNRASHTAGMFRNFYENNAEQTFVPDPLDQSEVVDVAERAARREWHDRSIVKAQREVAGLLNVPKAEFVTTNKMPWALTKPGSGVPVGTPRVDWDALDATPDSEKEQQVAMLDESSEPGDPIWLGFGAKHGTEAGIYEEYLNAHMQVTGGTRKGKTTALTNINRQLAERGYGGLVVVNGKESDEDRFIEEFPADRDPEDFVFIDTGDDYDKRVRFNLLEVPTDAEPGTAEFDSAAESLAEDWAASFAEAGGGSDNYWGALMDRVTKTVIVGLAKRGDKATPLDVAAACSSSDGLDKFSQFMDDERIAFVRQQAERIAEKEDTDLEPLAGRMDILTRHAGLRNFLCARDPSASIQDLVEDGKWCIVRIDPNLSETEIKFMLTPLVRRFYTAKKTAADAPRFYLMWDEFDKAVSPNTNVHELLSIAGGHDFRMILSCQAPSNQLYGKLKNAMQNQVDTALSFGTGEEDAKYVASHHSVDADALSGMGRYKFWLRTYYRHMGEEDKTDSYLVNAFPPTREVREKVEGTTPHDAEQMKRQSVELYGDVPKSAEELQAESEFYNDVDAPTDADTADGKQARNAALKAVYDETIRHGDPGGWIAVAECVDRLNRYLPSVDATDAGKAWRKVLQEVPDPYIDRREVDDEMEVKPLDTGFLNLGDSENDGKAEHWAPMADAYVPMTQLGFIFEIPEQTGDAMPDGLARLDDVIEINRDDDPDEIADAVNAYREDHPLLDRLAGTSDAYIESEHTTGSTQPSQTVKNLAQAHNAGHRCLFFAREDVAEQVYETVATEPFCCRSSHPDEGEQRFYTGTNTLSIDGETITRPGGRENVWVYDEQTGKYELRDGDGTVHARFNSAADIFTDASAYPDGGDRNVKPPIIPEYEMDGDLHEVEWDVIVVPSETKTPMDIRLYEDDEQTPLPDLLSDDKQAEKIEQESQAQSETQLQQQDSETMQGESADDESDESLPRL
ncbi:hypothetical protein DMJ13_26005 [halophilic archaeon]|nr:hypothetical protein DMJ13_26005 [halophilic archaeon]